MKKSTKNILLYGGLALGAVYLLSKMQAASTAATTGTTGPGGTANAIAAAGQGLAQLGGALNAGGNINAGIGSALGPSGSALGSKMLSGTTAGGTYFNLNPNA